MQKIISYYAGNTSAKKKQLPAICFYFPESKNDVHARVTFLQSYYALFSEYFDERALNSDGGPVNCII